MLYVNLKRTNVRPTVYALAAALLGLAAASPSAAYETGFVWQRSADYTAGTINDSSVGNPNLDQMGNPVWHYRWGDQLSVETDQKWYDATPSDMVWSSQWFGRPELARWQRSNEGSPVVDGRQMTLANLFGNNERFIPFVEWANPTGASAIIDVTGAARVFWGFNASPGPIETLIARRAADGTLDPLFNQSFDKPTADNSSEFIDFDIDLRDVMIGIDERLVFSTRKNASFRFDENIGFREGDLQLTLVPEPASLALLGLGGLTLLRRKRRDR